MGIGDNLIATGLARGWAAKGRKVAFGDGRKIMWDQHSSIIFRGNPNIAAPGEENQAVKWIEFYKGNRLYNRHDPANRRWVWNMDFRVVPGEVFLDDAETKWAAAFGRLFVVVEPNVPAHKSVAPNKQWPVDRFDRVAEAIKKSGHEVVQFSYGRGHRLSGARQVQTPSFRHALALLHRASLYIGPEGGLHHGAAAMGTPAVVLFGGFIPPQVTGYDMHSNLTGGAEACGSLEFCLHCRQAMERISADEVISLASERLAA